MSSKRKRSAPTEAKKTSNYRTIHGQKYDKGMLTTVESATADKDKINIDDCKKLFVEIIDGNKYTDIEKQTMKYIRENYKFESDADQWIRRAIASWAAKKAIKEKEKEKEKAEDSKSETKKEEKEAKLYCSCNEPDDGFLIGCDAQLAGCYNWYHGACVNVDKDKLPEVWFCPSCSKKGQKVSRGKKEKPKKESYYKQIDGKKYDAGMINAADVATQGKHDGRISEKDAKTIFQEAVDGDRITDCEYETIEYIRSKYTWTDKATNWFNAALAKWEEDHPRKKPRARAAKEKKEGGEEKKKKAKKSKAKPKKKAKTDKKDEADNEEGGEEEKEGEGEKKANGDKADA